MTESGSIFWLMLMAGLAGGLGHCSGMCGPLVIFLSPREAGSRHTLKLQLGRVLSYALLGAVLAGLTSLAALEIDTLPAQRLAMLVAGAVLLLSGLSVLGLPILRRGWPGFGAGAFQWVGRWARRAGPFTLGLFWGLLPCGLLYSAYAAAAGAGAAAPHPMTGALQGALVMVLFGLGTMPTLLGISWAAEQLPVGTRTWITRLAGAIVAGSGILLIINAL